MSSGSLIIVNPNELLKSFGSIAKISSYLDLLESENKKINLVSRETSRLGLEKLSAESLVPFEIIENRSFENYLDIGSGGGMPSFPILQSFDIKNSVLIERTKKKASALARFSESLNLNCKVLDQTLEECRLDEKFDLITLRLVRLSKPLLSQIKDLLAPEGIFIYYSHYNKSHPKTNLNYSSYVYTTGDDSPVKSFTVFRP